MKTVAVVNLKGGTGKTTLSAFLAHALAEDGHRVLGVDTDPQGSLLRWAELAEWALPVAALPVKTVHRQLGGIADHEIVVIDTPPLEDQHGIVMSVLRIADLVLIPCGPTPLEYERLSSVSHALADAADLRPDGCAPEVAVVLTRTVAGAASTAVYREAITEAGFTVLPGEVRRLERYAQAYGDQITNAQASAYGDMSVYVNKYMREGV